MILKLCVYPFFQQHQEELREAAERVVRGSRPSQGDTVVDSTTPGTHPPSPTRPLVRSLSSTPRPEPQPDQRLLAALDFTLLTPQQLLAAQLMRDAARAAADVAPTPPTPEQLVMSLFAITFCL